MRSREASLDLLDSPPSNAQPARGLPLDIAQGRTVGSHLRFNRGVVQDHPVVVMQLGAQRRKGQRISPLAPPDRWKAATPTRRIYLRGRESTI